MSVVTLTATYVSQMFNYPRGWKIKITGLKPREKSNFLKLLSPETIREIEEAGGNALELHPKDRDYLQCGCHEPPSVYVTRLLNLLVELGFRVVGTQSLATGEFSTYPVYLWTLQMV